MSSKINSTYKYFRGTPLILDIQDGTLSLPLYKMVLVILANVTLHERQTGKYMERLKNFFASDIKSHRKCNRIN